MRLCGVIPHMTHACHWHHWAPAEWTFSISFVFASHDRLYAARPSSFSSTSSVKSFQAASMTTPISENKQRMLRGELYHAFTPELVDERARCTKAVNRFNDTRETSRRHRVELWR